MDLITKATNRHLKNWQKRTHNFYNQKQAAIRFGILESELIFIHNHDGLKWWQNPTTKELLAYKP